ncbi:MAG: hypothetical protein ACREDE_05665, partial [Thermoplasmata archaeon]
MVAISIVVELGVSGLIPDFGPMPPGPVAFPTAYATAEARMQERPGGPWVFTGATAFDLVSGGPYSPSDLFPHYLSCGYDIALVAAPGVEIPAFDGSVPSDLAPWWVFSYASEAGDVTVFAVTDARAIPLAEIVSGPPCGPLVLAHYPALPAGIIADSPSMIANLSPPGGALPCPTCFGGAPPGGTSAEFNSTPPWYDGIF